MCRFFFHFWKLPLLSIVLESQRSACFAPCSSVNEAAPGHRQSKPRALLNFLARDGRTWEGTDQKKQNIVSKIETCMTFRKEQESGSTASDERPLFGLLGEFQTDSRTQRDRQEGRGRGREESLFKSFLCPLTCSGCMHELLGLTARLHGSVG
mmetsp:Transcript_38366/g.75325  ORF Transcript_38366/g.75325 Transcript_38366/m.75325 type:complete len:153 (+) Transcript_38366:125-583(+)